MGCGPNDDWEWEYGFVFPEGVIDELPKHCRWKMWGIIILIISILLIASLCHGREYTLTHTSTIDADVLELADRCFAVSLTFNTVHANNPIITPDRCVFTAYILRDRWVKDGFHITEIVRCGRKSVVKITSTVDIGVNNRGSIVRAIVLAKMKAMHKHELRALCDGY